MKRLLLFLFASFCVLCGRAISAAPPRPNILLIYTDDHGWADVGAQGVDRDIRTPNLDQLARDGVIFKRGYVTAPQCTPSRAAVITGIYQNRFGVEHNGISMKSEVVTLPERLKTAGYVTGMSGKWHLDVENPDKKQPRKHKVVPELAPHFQGFDEYFNGSMQDYTASHALDGTPFPDAPRKVRDERCRVVIQTEAALSFLERRAAKPGQPWFLYLAFMAPHVPLESPEPWFSKTPAHLPKERRQALTLIGAIDDGVGRIRVKLKEMGAEKNTLIFFIGDNGAPLGGAWDGSINLPMRGQKGMLSEGGIRTPFLAAWPGRIPAGQTYDHPVISLDVAATATASAGLPHDSKLDGVNLMPFLTGENKAAPHQTLYWRWMSQAAIQEFPYKLIALGGHGSLLFDITTPEGENIERNLMTQKPDIAARLETKLKAWCATLQPPGMPPPLADRHVQLFAEHGISAKAGPAAVSKSKPAPEGTIQGWLCRNGTLAIKDGALIIKPDAKAAPNARPFITNSSLDIPGPVTTTLRLRAKQGGKSTLTWRTKQQPDFIPANAAAFDWPASADWQEVKVELPATGRIIHLRITPAKGSTGLEVQSIELCSKDGKSQTWQFSNAN
ncbi:MAG: sulfatase-like hydrolase/transferase [Verrucomicrobia bacterium]|nr:sulfatase-like hydrolase/transferase [Verrucomicrobiota bacterium]